MLVKMSKCRVYLSWLDILDVLGNVCHWGPMRNDYRRAFWSDLHYRDRVLVATFCYQNGATLNAPEAFFRIRGKSEFHVLKLKQLFDYWNDPERGYERRSRYWAYDMYLGCFADLNGVPRPGQERYVIQ